MIRGMFDRILKLLPPERRRDVLLRLFRYSGRELTDDVVRENGADPPQARRVIEAYSSVVDGLMEMRNTEIKRNIIKPLLELDNKLYRLISAGAQMYDNGVHPKHRMIGYHDFFCSNIGPDESVLDIGCGNGFLASDMAKCTTRRVLGIDKSVASIEFAKAHYRSENLQFMVGDITDDIELPNCDVVVLSNVLEHLPERVQFLQRVRDVVKPKKFLIRVPMYEREWMVPFKKELGIDSRLDPGHYVEYTQEQLAEELQAAGLVIEQLEITWGEFWGRARNEKRSDS